MNDTALAAYLDRTGGGARTEQELGGDDDVLAAYRDHFGIVLDQVPSVIAGRLPQSPTDR